MQVESYGNGSPLPVLRSPFSEDNRFFVPEQVSVLRSWAIDDEADDRGKRNEARGKKIKISSFRPLASDLKLFPRTGP